MKKRVSILSFAFLSCLLSGPSLAQEDLSEQLPESAPVVDLKLHITIDPKPNDNGGNIFLAGFESVDQHGIPTEDTQPADFKQLGMWVKDWPHIQEVQLFEGLYYTVLYGYADFPQPKDMHSKTATVADAKKGILKFVIEEHKGRKQQDIPKGTPPTEIETVKKLPDGLQKTETTVEVTMSPDPDKWGGTIFLTGFEKFDETLGMPARGAEPDHFEALARGVQSFPITGKAKLKPNLGYFAMYGHGDHPEGGDRMSAVVRFEETDTLTIHIADQIVGKPPMGAPEAATKTGDSNPQRGDNPDLVGEMPAEKKQAQRNMIWLYSSIPAGLLLGWWFQRNRRRRQSIRARLESVGESSDDS